MEEYYSLHDNIKKGAVTIYIATSIMIYAGLIIDAVKLHDISDLIIYINAFTFLPIVISNVLYSFKVVKLHLSFAIIVYAIIINSYVAFFTVPFNEYENQVLFRNSFFFIYLIVLTYIIVNKYHGVLISVVHIIVFTYMTLSSKDPFMMDSLLLFILILAAVSAVTYYSVKAFEKSIHEQVTNSKIIEKQNVVLNDTNTLLEERQQQIEEQSEILLGQKTELSKINGELKGLVATKDKFFFIIAHDLKTPFVLY